MPSTAIDSQIHGSLFSTDEMRKIWSDESWAQKWLDTYNDGEANQTATAEFLAVMEAKPACDC